MVNSHSPHSNTLNRILILGLLAICVYSAIRPKRDKYLPEEPPELQALIPEEIGSWVFVEPKKDSPTTDTSQAEFLNGMHIGAYQSADGHFLVLAVEYGSDFRRQHELHIPTYCHRARGDRIEMLPISRVKVDNQNELPIVLMAWKHASTETEALCGYWIVVNGKATSQMYELKLQQLVAGILSEPKPMYLVRIDSFTSQKENDLTLAERQALIESFIIDMYKSANPNQRKALFGI